MAGNAAVDTSDFIPDSDTSDFVPDHADTSDFIPDEPPKVPNMNPIKNVLTSNLKAARDAAKGQDGKAPEIDPHPAQGFLDDWLSGWQMSTAALGITRRKLPDTVLPQDAGRFAKILSSAGQLAGDLPAMAFGGMIGGTATTLALGPEAAPIGSGAGAFALPSAIRSVLMDHYKKGDIQSFGDFYDRASGAFLASLKSGTVGALTSGAGMATGALMPAAASPFIKLGTTTAAEGAVMTTVGAAMEGRVPKLDDFTNTALLLMAMHGSTYIAGKVAAPLNAKVQDYVQNKVMDIYAKTGLKPNEVLEAAANDPTIHQELMSKDSGTPSALERANEIPNPQTQKLPNDNDYVNPNLSQASVEEGPGELKVEPLKAKEQKYHDDGERPPPTDEMKYMLSKIGEQPEAVKEKYNFDEFYRQYIDAKDPIKIASRILSGEEGPKIKEDPWALSRSMMSGRRADNIIENGPRDFEDLSKTGSRGLKDIWEEASQIGSVKEFEAFRVAQREVLDLKGRGIESGIDFDKASKVVKDYGPKYEDLSNEATQFGNDNLAYLRDSGRISDEAYNSAVELNKHHVSFKRVMEPEDVNRSGGTSTNPLKEIKGSERLIQRPSISDVENAHAVIAMAEKNRVALAMTDLIDKANAKEDFSIGKKVKTPMMATEISSEEIQRELEKQGIIVNRNSIAKDLKSKGLDVTPEQIDKAFENEKQFSNKIAEAFTVFRASKRPLEANQIESYKNGVRQVYEVSPKLAEAFKGLDEGASGDLMKMLSIPAKALRAGQLSGPTFSVRHFIRQEATAAAFNKYGFFKPVFSTLSSVGEVLGNSEEWQTYLANGGASDSITYIDQNYLQKKIFDLNEETGMLDKGWNTVKSGSMMFRTATQILDEARTFAKYKLALDKGLTPQEAVFESRDSGIDISRMGAKMKGVTMLIPFTNARVQGLDLIARSFDEDPVGVSAKLFSTITLPSIYLWYANHDQQWYKNLTDRDRDTNWHINVGTASNPIIIKLPKPFEPGVTYGSLVERALDKFFGHNPRAFKGFQNAMIESVLPQDIPTFAAPIIEMFANKSLYSGAPLIPERQKDLLPEYQSSAYTSTFAKVVASALRTIPIEMTQKHGSLGSPIIIDNFVKGWSGEMGSYMVAAASKALEASGAAKAMGVKYSENRPEKTLADIPFIKGFVERYPTASTQNLTDFYDRFEETQSRLSTIQMLAKTGDVRNYKREMIAAGAADQMFNLTGYKQAISNQTQMIKTIYDMPNMNAHQKRQQIETLYTAITKEATFANKVLDNLDEALKKSKEMK